MLNLHPNACLAHGLGGSLRCRDDIIGDAQDFDLRHDKSMRQAHQPGLKLHNEAA